MSNNKKSDSKRKYEVDSDGSIRFYDEPLDSNYYPIYYPKHDFIIKNPYLKTVFTTLGISYLNVYEENGEIFWKYDDFVLCSEIGKKFYQHKLRLDPYLYCENFKKTEEEIKQSK